MRAQRTQSGRTRRAAGLAAFLLAGAPMLLAPASASADGTTERNKAAVEYAERTAGTHPSKAQVEHQESLLRQSGSAQPATSSAESRSPAPVSGDNGAAGWQLALSAALGAALAGGVVMGARQVNQHRHALPA